MTALGIGGMIGGGIFAVLGLAISVAGHAVALTLAGAGVIALLTGISYARLGVELRGSGGSFSYVHAAFPGPLVADVSGWLLIAGYVGTLALYSTAFGDYGAALIHGAGTWRVTSNVLAAAALAAFFGINLRGAKLSGTVELGVVAVKLGILAVFAVLGLRHLHASHFTPVFNHGIVSPIAAIALIFVAYEGFELIPNAIEEMQNPDRNLGRALIIGILVTAVVYVLVAIAALGNLDAQQIQKDQEYVLAVAAKPMLGAFGFVLIGIAAVLSTASAINATLFGAARLGMVMAEERALPRIFARRTRAHHVPWVSLLILTVLSIALALGAKLNAISTFASATFLLIFLLVNLSAARLHRRIRIAVAIPVAGAALSAISFLVLLWHTWQTDKTRLYLLVGFYAAAVLVQLLLVRLKPPRQQTPSPGD